MKLPFTKMQGAGNDFVVLDATTAPLHLSPDQLRQLGDRRYGVGADQILVVERSHAPGIDFGYRIFNGADGSEVEQCGNGARCFVRYVHDHGLSTQRSLRVSTMNRVLELHLQADGRVRVDMNAPVFELPQVPFNAQGLQPRQVGDLALWPVDMAGQVVELAVLSMGNPHAVQVVADVEAAPVSQLGPLIEKHPRFARQVNAGFMQVVSRSHIRLRVHERGAGETLACGTGACAAVVAGVRLGFLDSPVEVDAPGGRLTIEWAGGVPRDTGISHNAAPALQSHVFMTGPAVSVFEGEIEL